MELVTVVITTFNGGAWITKTLDDVAAQTYRNFELIVVNDGSKDDTLQKIQAWQAVHQDARLSIIDQPNSGTAARPRNVGLKLAKGELICFLDHDDRWRPERLARLVAAFQAHPDVDAVSHDEQVTLEGTALKVQRYGSQDPNLYRFMLLHGNCFSTSALMLRTQVVRDASGFDERREFFTVEDFDLWLRLARDGIRFYAIHEVLGEYVLHQSNISGSTEKNYDLYHNVYEAHLEGNSRLNRREVRKAYGRLEYSFGRSFSRDGSRARALHCFIQALKLGYSPIKVLIGFALALVSKNRLRTP